MLPVLRHDGFWYESVGPSTRPNNLKTHPQNTSQSQSGSTAYAGDGIVDAAAGETAAAEPEVFRRDTFNKFQADINRCIGEIFGKTARKIPTQTFDIAPALDVTVNGRELAKRSSVRGQFSSIMGLNDPNRGKNGTVYIQSGAWNYPNYPLDILQGAYLHEYGNILSSRYGHGDEYKFGDKAGIGKGFKDKDAGANFQRCIFPSSVKW